jgi:hypothetical protein
VPRSAEARTRCISSLFIRKGGNLTVMKELEVLKAVLGLTKDQANVSSSDIIDWLEDASALSSSTVAELNRDVFAMTVSDIVHEILQFHQSKDTSSSVRLHPIITPPTLVLDDDKRPEVFSTLLRSNSSNSTIPDRTKPRPKITPTAVLRSPSVEASLENSDLLKWPTNLPQRILVSSTQHKPTITHLRPSTPEIDTTIELPAPPTAIVVLAKIFSFLLLQDRVTSVIFELQLLLKALLADENALCDKESSVRSSRRSSISLDVFEPSDSKKSKACDLVSGLDSFLDLFDWSTQSVPIFAGLVLEEACSLVVALGRTVVLPLSRVSKLRSVAPRLHALLVQHSSRMEELPPPRRQSFSHSGKTEQASANTLCPDIEVPMNGVLGVNRPLEKARDQFAQLYEEYEMSDGGAMLREQSADFVQFEQFLKDNDLASSFATILIDFYLDCMAPDSHVSSLKKQDPDKVVRFPSLFLPFPRF